MQSLSRTYLVATMDVLNTFGLTSGSRGIQNEQPVLRIHLLAFALFGLAGN